jgi:hypothetical protein
MAELKPSSAEPYLGEIYNIGIGSDDLGETRYTWVTFRTQ